MRRSLRPRSCRPRTRLLRCGLAALLAGLAPGVSPALDAESWRDPPPSARPVARWWWPGGAVDEAGLRADLERIRAAGFGAVEVQPFLLGLSEDDLAADPRIRSVGTEPFARRVAFAAREAAARGLAFDLTLGSGWPGGLPDRRDVAERQLLMASAALEEGARRTALPPPEPPDYAGGIERLLDALGPFDADARLVAVLAVRIVSDGRPATFDRVEVLTDRVEDGALHWEVPAGGWRLLVFYENRTAHTVMGGAYPGGAHDALAVDHLSAAGARALWTDLAEPLLAAAPPGSVRGVFVDSFELIGELPWTPGFLDAFRERKGYDLTPHLPLLFLEGGESKYGAMVDILGRKGGPVYQTAEGAERRVRIREDYEAVREALFLEAFLDTLAGLARRDGVSLRLQAHGGFADYLDAYARADVPESEGLFAGGSTDFLKLAASAAHVAGRPVASSETFVVMRLRGSRLTPPEIDLLAGRALAAGINQIVHHGVPYPYERAGGDAWYPFRGGLGDMLAGPMTFTTWFRGELWDALPAVNRRLARLVHAMRQGEHAADVAWLRAEGVFPDRVSIEWGRVDPREGESEASRALRARGLVYDRVSRRQLRGARTRDGALRVGAARYRALLLDPMEAAEPELLERVQAAAEAGVPVIAMGPLPARAPGAVDAAQRDAAVRERVARLRGSVTRVPDEEALPDALAALGLEGPLVAADGGPLRLSVEHRRSVDGHVLLVFNESWSATRQTLRTTVGSGPVVLWDPGTGERRTVRPAGGAEFELALEPAESIVLTVAP